MKNISYLVSGMLAASLMTGCATPIPLAVITYNQIGVCTQANLPDGSSITAPARRAIVLLRITRIDNTDNAINWNFSPLLLNAGSDTVNLGGDNPPIPIAANKIVPVNRPPVGIMVETLNADGSDAAKVRYTPSYTVVPPAPGTIFVDKPPFSGSSPFNPDCNKL